MWLRRRVYIGSMILCTPVLRARSRYFVTGAWSCLQGDILNEARFFIAAKLRRRFSKAAGVGMLCSERRSAMARSDRRSVRKNDEIGVLLQDLFRDYSDKRAVAWLERKFDGFDTSKAKELSVDVTKNDRENFKSARILGYVRTLPTGKKNESNRPVLVASIAMKRDISERSSRLIQFNFAKKVLQEAIRGDAAGLDGYPSQGLFFFYDNDQYFRLSLVSGEMDGKKFKFNSAKRQSFFINPERPNNIAKSRLSERIATFDELKDAFSVETLTKEFYTKLFEWYEWALKPRTGVTFPNKDDDNSDDTKYNNVAIIRLITRLMFTWFIRQRGIVPNELFTSEGAARMLKGFRPTSMEDDNYYRCVLQNLFFATFNCQPDKRKFIRRSYKGASDGFFVKTKYRYEKEFVDAKAFVILLRDIPFLNCALFDCLDRQVREEDGGGLELFDGFSDTRKRQAHVPNGLFFNPDRGIIQLFERYEFTIDENNADDADIALDPELLGKVFENLLGAFNPETKDTARNATGSFYTPREIVDYMVAESLKCHLRVKLASVAEKDTVNRWLDDLFDPTAEAEGRCLPFDEDVASKVRDALYASKILDPACGSGAFPMGILQAMVRLFRRLDPHNVDLNDRIIRRYRDEKSLPPDPMESAEERGERLAAIEQQLKDGQHYPDYARKLYLIENCIYGIDIQPIAVQIAKLRFFISLLCDQLKDNWNANEKNAGLLSLPNLEAKFVCANTLIALPKTEGELALATAGIVSLRQKLQANRHKIFRATTFTQKQKLKEKDLELRDQIREAVRGSLAKPDKQLIKVQRELIESYLVERTTYETPRMVRRKKAVQGDLFGEAVQGELEYEDVDLNKAKRDAIDAKIDHAKRKIAAEEAKSQPANVTAIDKLANLVAGWDPYDQNASSPFFDPKWMFNIEEGFDIVIGNPPYVRRTDIPDVDKAKYELSFQSAKGQYDLYLLFIEWGLQCMGETGNLVYINPIRFFNAEYGRCAREYIAKNYKISSVLDISQLDVFESALTYPCVIRYSKATDEEIINNLIEYRKLENLDNISYITKTNVVWLQQQEILNDSEYRILTSSKDVREVIKKMNARGRQIGCMFSVARGLPNREVDFHGDTCVALKSKGVLRYAIDRSYLVKIRTKFAPAFAPEMVILPRTVRSLIAATKPRGMVPLDRIYYLEPIQKTNLQFVVGVINSRLTNFWFEDSFSTTKVSGGYFDLNGNQIKPKNGF